MDTMDQSWGMAIIPPKNWQNPISITERDLALLTTVASRLSLVVTRDDKRKKIYLGNALASETEVASGLRYPNGWTADVVPLEEAGPE